MTQNPKPAQMRQKKARGPYTPEATQTRVIVKKIAGKTNSAIAREEGIDRHTCGRILNDSQYRDLIKAFRPEVRGIVPKALKVFNKALDLVTEEVPAPPAGTEKIEVLDGDELRRRLDQAYKRGLAAGLDGMKAATETLKGSQVFTQRQEVAVEEKPIRTISEEELEARYQEAVESHKKRAQERQHGNNR